MATVFRPAVSLMNHLRLPQKFALICLLFIVPFGFVMWQLLAKFHSEASLANTELTGNTYLRPINNLLRDVIEHQALVNSLDPGDAQARTQVLAKQAAVESDLAAVDKFNQTLGESLNASTTFELVKADW